MATETGVVEPSCLAASGISEELSALHSCVVNMLSEARAPSTRRLYALKWGVFVKWCRMLISTRLLAPCLRFLWYRLDSGSLPSMLKVHVAVIASFRSLLGGKSIGRHSLVMSFLKRARRLHPTRPPSVPPWSLGVVLRALSQLSLERLASVDMKELSLKRALLLALASAKHIGDLHVLSVDSDCIRFKPGGCSVTLRPRPVYVLNHYPPPSERRPFRFLPCLLSH